MSQVVPMIGLGSTVVAAVNMLRYAVNRNVNGVATLGAAWLGGWGMTALAAHSSVTDGVTLMGSQPIAATNWADQLLYGIAVASFGSFGVEVKKALDRSDNASKPRLIPPRRPRAEVPPMPAPPQ